MTNISQILKKLRKYEVRIRKSVNSQNHGNFDSIFKGTGLEFDDVRQYQYGDDVRTINWNVTAKGHGIFVKTFKEEKEQSVFFVIDVSASQQIGKSGTKKTDISKEIGGVLMLSAARDQSKVGLALFSDQREYYMKPSKGNSKTYEAIQHMFLNVPDSVRTNLTQAIRFTLSMIKRRSLVILISDFIDADLEKPLINLSKMHDLICIHVQDDMETRLPALGIIPVYDLEGGGTTWLNTNSSKFAGTASREIENIKQKMTEFAGKYRFDFISVNTGEDFVPALIRLFKTRNKKKKRA